MTDKTAFKNDTGLLWFDPSPIRDLTDKIGQAARRHRQKYGVEPNLCYVHPSALSDNEKPIRRVGDVKVSGRSTVLVHHFWIGIDKMQGRLL